MNPETPGAAPLSEARPKRRIPAPLRALRALTVFILLCAAAWALLIATIHLYGKRDEAREADTLVVLGAAQYDGRPSPVLKARLDHAVDLYKRGIARRLIMTGGVGAGDTVSEAVVSRRYAVKSGVPAKAILTERSGLTTLESMRAVAQMMDREGLTSAVLVSDPFHMLRLKLLAMRVGIRGYTSPTRTSPISKNRAAERKHVLRESMSLPFALVEDAF